MSEQTGLITIGGKYDVAETSRRFRAAAQGAGLLIFAEIDHGQTATEVGVQLRATRLIIFGHPRGGTPLMQLNQTVGIDLPFKVLVWENRHGEIWLTYNDPEWLVERHQLGKEAEETRRAISVGMKKLISAATG